MNDGFHVHIHKAITGMGTPTQRQDGKEVVFLNGDHEKMAQRAAGQLGIGVCRLSLLPKGKVDSIRELQNEGFKMTMAGDGLNDAPDLKTASVNLAHGDIGDHTKPPKRPTCRASRGRVTCLMRLSRLERFLILMRDA